MSTPLLFISTVLIWGSTFLVITFQLGEVAPAVSVVYRFGIGTLILFAWSVWRDQKLWIGWRRQPWLIMQGVLNFGLSYLCTYNAEGYVVSALVAVLFALMVFWNALGARLFFGSRITWRTLCAAALSITGVALLFSRSLQGAWHPKPGSNSAGFLFGLALAVGATLSASAGNMVAVQVGRTHQNSVLVTTAWAMFWGMLSVAIWALATGQTWSLPNRPVYWLSMLYLALFGSVIAFTSYFTLINRIGPGKAAYTGVLTPVVSVLLSMQFEGYRPGAVGVFGMALCLAGVIWAVRGKSAPTRGDAKAAPADLNPATGDHA
ncbi:MAG: EamA family transporter [Herminiimonas sp.]|nr:EamA family transporter [Herminiimonas sp.]